MCGFTWGSRKVTGSKIATPHVCILPKNHTGNHECSDGASFRLRQVGDTEMASDEDIIVDAHALDRIALMLRVVNQADCILSEHGIDVLTTIVGETGRVVH